MTHPQNIFWKLGPEHIPIECESIEEWGETFKDKDRFVDRTESGKVLVSTVFLGLDHNFASMYGPDPLLFETMIFGGIHDEYQQRYSTWEEAKKGHAEACVLAFTLAGTCQGIHQQCRHIIEQYVYKIRRRIKGLKK